MGEKINAASLLALVVLTALFGFGLAWMLKPSLTITTPSASSERFPMIAPTVRRDTVRVPVVRERVRLIAVPADTLIVLDLDSGVVLETPPFRAELDTITPRGDTARLAFAFPARTFDFELAPAPDSIETRLETITITLEAPRPWYEPVLWTLAGAAAGAAVDRFLLR